MGVRLDENVVSLQFDNKDVNRNVLQTMKLLQELQEVLKFHDAGRSFTALTQAANAVQLNGIQNALNNVEKRFSAFGIASTRIIWDLTGLIEKKLGGAISGLWNNTIGQAQSGGFRRALNIKQADFQMRGLLKDAEDMEAQVAQIRDDINYAVSGTAYSYDAAAKVAAQLLASQVSAGDDMQKALRAISGLAAMTNSSYEDIGNIMTDIAGQGKVSNEMLTRFSYRGMNAAAALGKQLGKTEEEIRQMVKKGQIDFQTFANAMDAAFGEHATEANKTYTGSLDNMKAALSRIGAVFYEDHLDVMRDLFNALRVAINAANVILTPFIKKMTALERAVLNPIIDTIVRMTGAIQRSSLYVWLTDTAKAAKETTDKIKDYSDIVNKVIRGDYGNGQKRVEALTKAGFDYATVQALVNKKLYGYDVALKDLTDDQIKAIAYDDAQVEALKKLREQAKNTGKTVKNANKQATPFDILNDSLKTIQNFKKAINKVFKGFKKAWKDVFGKTDFMQGFLNIIGTVIDGFKYLSKVLKGDKNTAGRWYQIFKAIFVFAKDVFTVFKRLFDFLAPIIGKLIVGALVTIFDIVSGIARHWNKIHDRLKLIGKALKRNFIDPIKDFLKKVFEPLRDKAKELWDKIFGKFRDWTFTSDTFFPVNDIVKFIDKAGEVFRNFVDHIKEYIDKAKEHIHGLGEKLYNIPLVKKFVDKVKELADKFSELDFSIHDIPEYFEHFIEKLKDAKKYVKKFKDAIGHLVDKLIEMKDAFMELEFVKDIIGILDKIAEKANKVISSIKNFVIEKLPGKIDYIVKKFKEWWGILKNSKPLETFVNSIKSIFENLTSGKFINDFLDQLINIKNFVMELFGGGGLVGNGVGEGSLSVNADILGEGGFEQILRKVQELTQPIKDAIDNMFSDPESLYNKAFEAIKSILQGFADAINFKNFNLETVKRLFVACFMILSIIKLFEGIKALIKSTDAMKAVLLSISDVFKSASRYFDAKAMNVSANAMWTVAKSLLMIVAAIVALGFLDTQQLGQAIGAIAVVLLVLSLFVFALAKLNKYLADRDGLKNQAKAMDTAAQQTKQAAVDIQSLGQTFATGITGAAKLLAQGLGDAAKALANGISKAFIIVAMVYALSQIVGILNDFMTIDWFDSEKVWPAIIAMIITLGLLTAVAKIMQAGPGSASIGDALLFVALAKSLQMIGVAVKIMAESATQEGFWHATLALYGFMALMALLAFVMKNFYSSEKSIKSTGAFSKTGPLIALGIMAFLIAEAMMRISIATAIIAAIPENNLLKATDVLGTFGLLIIVLMIMSKDYGSAITGGTAPLIGLGVMAVLMSIALNMMIPAITTLTTIARFSPVELWIAVGVIAAIAFIIGMLTAVTRLTGGTAMLKVAIAFVIVAEALNIMVGALTLLAAAVKVGGIGEAIGTLIKVLVVMGIALGVLVVVAKFFGEELVVAVGVLIALAAAFVLISGGLWLFNQALLVAGAALPAFANGLVSFCQTILDNIPLIIGAILAVIAAIAIAIIAGSHIAAAAVVAFVTAVAIAFLFALSNVSEETVAQAGQILGSGIAKIFIFLFHVIWGLLSTLWTWLNESFPKWFEGMLPTLLYGVKMMGLSLLDGIVSWFIDPLGNLIEKISGVSLSSKVHDWVTKTKEEINKGYEEFKATKDNAPDDNIFMDPEKIDKDAQDTSDAITEGTDKIGFSFEDAQGMLQKSGGNGFVDGLLGLGQKAFDAGEGSGADSALGWLSGWNKTLGSQEDMGSSIVDFACGDGTTEQFNERAREMMQDGLIPGFGEGLEGADSDILSGYLNQMFSNAEDTAETHSPSKRTERMGDDIMTGLENGINDHDGTAGDALATAVDNMIQRVGDALNELGAKATQAMEGFKSSVSSGFSSAAESATNFTDGVGSKIGAIPEALGDYGYKATNKFKTGLEAGKNKAKNAAKAIADAVKKAINVGSSFYNIAVNAGNSFVNGLRSKIQAAANAAAEMMRKSIDKARETMDMHSPSKVFRAIGYSAGEGYIQGVERMISPVERVSEGMAESSIEAMRLALQDVDTLATSDLDLNPVITPVMDLTGVRSGIDTLDTMVARSSALTALTGLNANESKWSSERAISNSLNAMVANSGNSDVVMAIESLKADNAQLRAAIASMRVVMNNRFVGQVDTSLGRQQKLVNRG